MSEKRRSAFRVIGLIFIVVVIAAAVKFVLFKKAPAAADQPGENEISAVEIIKGGTWGEPVAYGLSRLQESLQGRGVSVSQIPSLSQASGSVVLLIGTPGESRAIQKLLEERKFELSQKKEALAVKRIQEGNKNILVVAGSDDRGLMYALLGLSHQIRALDKGENWFSSVREASETPLVPVRGVVVFLHSEDLEKDWYYSPEFWQAYLGMLAADRWNTINLVFSHQTPYLSPMYAFHVNVEEYPEVRARGLTEEQRQKNLETLQLISSMAREKGLDFTLGIWQQIAWEGKNQGSRQESMVSGLTRKNMLGYTYQALCKLLRECPAISAIQLRINHESGLDYDEQTSFFQDAVFKAVKDCGRPVLLEIRDVGLLRETLSAAVDMNVPVRVSHKYWGEHMVFPYHPTRIMSTYSYGDWLKYPQRYSNIYQVWTLGSHRLLLWGDPGFVRRFAPTTGFEDGVGFEICAPLSQKGFGNTPGSWRIFRDKEREYYRWEFERYWSFYQLFGRLTYNPAAGDDAWLDELARRFGKTAAPEVASAYRSASQVLSYIMAAATSDYNMYIWPEKDMGGLLNFYLHLQPYDICRISGFLEFAADYLNGRSTAKLAPDEVARRLERIAEETEKALDRAGEATEISNKEFWATKMDFLILSNLARFYSNKIRAAGRLGFFYSLGDLSLLKEAQDYASDEIALWKKISALGEEIYSDNLVFGPASTGHWKDNLLFVEKDVEALVEQEELFKAVQNFDFGYDFGPRPSEIVNELYSPVYINSYTVDERFQGVFPTTPYDPEQGFGWQKGAELRSEEPVRIPRTLWRASNLENLNFPKEALLGDFIQGQKPAVFRIDLPEGLYQAAVFLTDRRAEATDHGPMTVSVIERFGERPIIADRLVRKGELVEARFNFNMVGNRFSTFRLKLSAAPGSDYIINALTITRLEPHIAHLPPRRTLPGKDVILKATVTLPPKIVEPEKDSLSIARGTTSTVLPPETIEGVRLVYSSDGGKTDRTVEMLSQDGFIYQAVIPAGEVRTGEIRYHLEAEDSIGQVVSCPAALSGENFYRIDVSQDRTPPTVDHAPVRECDAGVPLEIQARVSDESALAKVLLYYRPTRQTMEYSVVVMTLKGGQYSAAIPGAAITKEYDMMYYIEAVDGHGNGLFFPNPDIEQPYIVVKVRR